MNLTKEQLFLYNLLDDFRAFVIDSMDDGRHKDFDDHMEFLKASLEVWGDMEPLTLKEIKK